MEDPIGEMRLRGFDPAELAEARERVDRVAELRRAQARIDGEIAGHLARLAEIADGQGRSFGGSRGPEYARRSMAAEVAAATRVHPSTARAQLDEAERLVEGFPVTLAALRDGEISQKHARSIAGAGAGLDAGARASLDALAVSFARTRTPGQTERVVKLQAAQLAPRSWRQRHREARRERRVETAELDCGMSELRLVAPTFHVHAVRDRLTGMARSLDASRRAARRALAAVGHGAPEGGWAGFVDEPAARGAAEAALRADPGAGFASGADLLVRASDERSFDQLRADLLPDILLTAAPMGHEIAAAGTGAALAAVRASIQVTIPARMILDPSRGIGWSDRNGALIAPDDARAAAAGASGWSRLFAEPETGELLVTDRYRPTADQRRHLAGRDATCRVLGCTVPAAACDIDHTHDHAAGGPTAIENLACLCEAHHMMKHNSGWRLRQLGGGVLEWTSPTGNVYTDEPISRVVFRDVVPAEDLPPWEARPPDAARTAAPPRPRADDRAGPPPETGERIQAKPMTPASEASEGASATRTVASAGARSEPHAERPREDPSHEAENRPGVGECPEETPCAAADLPPAAAELSAAERVWLARASRELAGEPRMSLLADLTLV